MSDGQVLNDDDRCHLDVLVEENDRLPEEAQDAKDAADDAERRLAEAEAEQHRLRFRLDDVENERNREREHRVDEARRHLDTIAERDRLRAALRAVMTETGTSTLAHHYARDALEARP